MKVKVWPPGKTKLWKAAMGVESIDVSVTVALLRFSKVSLMSVKKSTKPPEESDEELSTGVLVFVNVMVP